MEKRTAGKKKEYRGLHMVIHARHDLSKTNAVQLDALGGGGWLECDADEPGLDSVIAGVDFFSFIIAATSIMNLQWRERRGILSV